MSEKPTQKQKSRIVMLMTTIFGSYGRKVMLKWYFNKNSTNDFTQDELRVVEHLLLNDQDNLIKFYANTLKRLAGLNDFGEGEDISRGEKSNERDISRQVSRSRAISGGFETNNRTTLSRDGKAGDGIKKSRVFRSNRFSSKKIGRIKKGKK